MTLLSQNAEVDRREEPRSRELVTLIVRRAMEYDWRTFMKYSFDRFATRLHFCRSKSNRARLNRSPGSYDRVCSLAVSFYRYGYTCRCIFHCICIRAGKKRYTLFFFSSLIFPSHLLKFVTVGKIKREEPTSRTSKFV